MDEVTEADVLPSPLALAMNKKLLLYKDRAIQGESCFIHRVHQKLREGDPRSYESQILSIGPYHYANPMLHAMEEHKWRYLDSLLIRKPQSDCARPLEECIQKVRASAARARSYYSERSFNLGSEDFVKMMVLDGCFILELFLRCYEGTTKDDPILDNRSPMAYSIGRDILVLENQIPFFILEELFTVAVVPSVTDLSLRALAFIYIDPTGAATLSTDEVYHPLPTTDEVYHLLHFYHLLLRPTPRGTSTNGSQRSSSPTTNRSPDPSVNQAGDTRPPPSRLRSVLKKMNPFKSPQTHQAHSFTFPCAVELAEAGIKFRGKEARTLLDVTFKDGTLSIPFLPIEDRTNSDFRNLIALEQCCPKLGQHFTWYVAFLDCIVNTHKDVTILHQLGMEVVCDKDCNYLVEVFHEVNKYCGSRWHKQCATLRRDYFGSPWSIISLVAAIALLLMTLAQVVLAVLSYRKQ